MLHECDTVSTGVGDLELSAKLSHRTKQLDTIFFAFLKRRLCVYLLTFVELREK